MKKERKKKEKERKKERKIEKRKKKWMKMKNLQNSSKENIYESYVKETKKNEK